MANLNFPSASSQKVTGVWGGLQGLLDEGALYLANNTTLGTAIATTTSVVDAGNSGATSAQTRPLAILVNNAPAADANARSIYPVYFNLFIPIGGQIPTSATSWQFGMWLDPIGVASYTSGGSTIVPTQLNPGAAGGRGSQAKLYFGAITAAASSSGAVLVGRRVLSNIIPTVGDEWMLTFGDPTMPTSMLLSAAVRKVTVPCAPVCVPPGYALKFGIWGPSNAAAPSFEFELCYAERSAGL